MSRLRFYLVLMYLSLFIAACNGRRVKEQMIFAPVGDSLVRQHLNILFDASGNYCINAEKNGLHYFYTAHDTFGGFKTIESISGRGSIQWNSDSSEQEKVYFKNGKGVEIYGPIKGKITNWTDGSTTQHLAVISVYKDSIFYYVDSCLVAVKKLTPDINVNPYDPWCDFSENGHNIYYVKRSALYYLFVDNKMIDSSVKEYGSLAVNNNGNYFFVGCKRKPVANDAYMIHTSDGTTGPVISSFANQSGLMENNASYFFNLSGDDDDVVFNNCMVRGTKNAGNFTLADSKNFLFTYTNAGKSIVKVNGRKYEYDFENIYYPNVDAKGNFSFYGLKDYYLYKYVNGKMQSAPISKYGVRAEPLYITATGSSLHYFKTDDSVYFYQDEILLMSAKYHRGNITVTPFEDLLMMPGNSNVSDGSSIWYLKIDTVGYMVCNGQFSKPFSAFDRDSVMEAQSSGSHYFLVLNAGPKRYRILMNNKIDAVIDKVERLIYNPYFFDGKHLTFYGIKNHAYYQFYL
ncbi:hypothetical protein [Taibaiella soli]|uniref:Uncharacterized protein n=1 Tax=Taibaiella soli TaxID=1649169 RepID=A0A2W2C3X6_9BACT|nr:hypothetical protein [Taibaiella soli]PZF74823.1 hypothetical protein DN068_01095 [Taibaiella soli]